MKDAIFVAHLVKLLPGDLKGEIESKATQAQAATHFLDKGIEPAVESKNDECINILLSVMESFGSIPLRELAQNIKEEIQKATGNAGEEADHSYVEYIHAY